MELPGPRGRTAPVHPPLRHGTMVGDLYMSASQVRSELDRVQRRMMALLRTSMRLAESDETRAAFAIFYADWRRFYDDAREDWVAWGSNVSEAQRYDQEADAWRARLAQAGAGRPADPTTSSTVDRSSGVSWGTLALLGGLAVLGVYLVRRDPEVAR